MFHRNQNARRGFSGWLSSGLALTAMGVAAWWLGRLSKDEELRNTLINRGRAYGDQLWRTATATAEKLQPETAEDQMVDVEKELHPGG